jgi:hypothetical protein
MAEASLVPYFQAARFPSKPTAAIIYLPLQRLVHDEEECDLSVYRFELPEGWHVVVVGEKPTVMLHVQIEAILTHGTLVSLTNYPGLVDNLYARKNQMNRFGPWVELHHPSSDYDS